MATLSNHYDETFEALKDFQIPDDIAYKISHFASLYADNPDKVREIKIGQSTYQYVLQTTVIMNNALHEAKTNTAGSSIRYFCLKPAFATCQKEHTRSINYTATINSQDAQHAENTVRHAMLSKEELGRGIAAGERYGVREEHLEGVNKINEKYYNILPPDCVRLYRRAINDRVLTIWDFYFFNKSILKDFFDRALFGRYLNEVDSYVKKMEDVAKRRGIRFGWHKIFAAAAKGKNFLSWDVDPNDSTGESGLALLGVGIHALQDAHIHEGENMDHFEHFTSQHILKDTFIGLKLKKITRDAVMVFLLMSENFTFISEQKRQSFQINTLPDLTDPQKEALSNALQKCAEFNRKK